MILVGEAEETAKNNLAASTQRAYQSIKDQYEIIIGMIDGAPPPYPPTTKTIICFLQYKKQMSCTYSTILHLYHCLCSVFKQSFNLNFSEDQEITKYMTSLNREMLGQSNPYATDAISKEMLIKISQKMNMNNPINIRDLALFTVQYETMMRVSEITNLEVNDVMLYENKASFTILKNKVDQFGKGRTIYINEYDSQISAFRVLKSYLTCRPQTESKYLFLSRLNSKLSPETIRRSLKKWIEIIGEDVSAYSTHSLRKGGCKCAFMHYVPAPAIQHQGGWSSSCFLRYGKMEAEEAAEALKIAFQ